mgnify:CR=1 FL=1
MPDDKPADQESPSQSSSGSDESSGSQFKPFETYTTTRGAKPGAEKKFVPFQTEGIPLSDSKQKNIKRLIDREDN